MIEIFIKNDLTLKRWRSFKARRLSWISCWAILIFIVISITAEFWANSKPLVLFYNDSLFFPVIKDYHPSQFGIEERFITNYKALPLTEKDWALWPPVKWDPYESNTSVDRYPGPPDSHNLLGTDDRGRDVLARLLYGYRYSMIFAVSVWFFSYLIGSFLGAIMGYFGGKTDLIGQRIAEIVDSLPSFVILITLATVIGQSFLFLVLFFSFMGWMGISFYMRAEFLRLRKRAFVEASLAQGRSQFGTMFKHIIPNALNPILTFSPFALATSIGALAILDYLGFGLPPPTPSWGELLSQSERHITTAWWLAVFPSLALFSTLLSLTFIGNGVRDAFDPREVS